VVRLWEAEAKLGGPAAGTINHLFALYRASPHYLHLAHKTRHEYRLELARLEPRIEDRMVDSLSKAGIIAVRNTRRHRPFAANATLRTLSAILTWGVTTFVARNPVRDIDLLPTQPRDAVWMEEHRTSFMEVAGPHLRRIFATLRYTVQRTANA
jgi:hypothetical protein